MLLDSPDASLKSADAAASRPTGGDDSSPVARYLRVALPGEQLQREAGANPVRWVQQEPGRDVVVLKQVVAELVTNDESELFGTERFKESSTSTGRTVGRPRGARRRR